MPVSMSTSAGPVPRCQESTRTRAGVTGPDSTTPVRITGERSSCWRIVCGAHAAAAPAVANPAMRIPANTPPRICATKSTARGAPMRRLLDRELALHPGLAMALDGAVVRVGAGREVRGERRGLPVADDLALALAVDHDVVVGRGLVGHLDLQLPGRRRRLRAGELQLAARVGRDRH